VRRVAPHPEWAKRSRDLLVRDPVAVEAERDAGRQVNACDRLAGKTLRRENFQVSGAGLDGTSSRLLIETGLPAALLSQRQKNIQCRCWGCRQLSQLLHCHDQRVKLERTSAL
jgi:hypothetical protein